MGIHRMRVVKIGLHHQPQELPTEDGVQQTARDGGGKRVGCHPGERSRGIGLSQLGVDPRAPRELERGEEELDPVWSKYSNAPTGQQFEPSGLQMPVGPQGLDQGISLLGLGRPDHL